MTSKNLQVYPSEDFTLLVGGTAHDLNNLLAGAQLQVDLAIRKLSSDSPATVHLSKVIEAMEHMTTFVDSLLLKSKGNQIRKQADLNDLIMKCVDISRLIIGEDVQIDLNFLPDLPPLHVDNVQLQQVILNLLLNAAESLTANSPEITINTGYTSAPQRNSEQGWWVTGDSGSEDEMVFFEVRDSGNGINNEALHHIFDPYYTTKDKGRGLGLPLVLGVVRSHDGRLFVSSDLGKGTVFKLFFPVVPGESKPRITNQNGWV